ncbi:MULTISPECIES: efflux transporter outer membrane subunit [Flavobacteriaceae]|uniref:Efflux transporter outer membrane subunit n=2 Tax=Flavobacteriaceae TaxID=49546 RepID=A0A4Y8ATS6_9FLAO|nr:MULTISPECIES: efflux transporter outer membrane subunit [Flavobacteriaceae]TEW74098.1 efflux transporter outer membrane subunit [Gramella jeungdoensis]GGK40223.1 multidrug transporter [Lutibacter litoralis]
MKKQNISKLLIVLIASVQLQSCFVAKDYKSPEVKTANLYRTDQVLDSTSIASISWDKLFTDSFLQQYINEGLANNYDVQIALESLKAAEATMKQSKQGNIPTLTGNASWVHQTYKDSDDFNQYELSGALSWEADIWGKIRSNKRASVASYLQTVAVQQAIQTQIVASIASTYYQLLALDAQVKVAEKTLINRVESVETIKALKEAGNVNEVSVKQTEAQQYATKIILKDLKYNVKIIENTLSILLGRTAGEIERGTFNSQEITANIAVGVPAALLSNRPDVVAAEFNFRRSFELTNIARSNFYPSLRVSASGGFQTIELEDWFNTKSLFASVLTGLTQPIFNQRKIKTNFEIAQANQQKAYLEFKQTLLLAGKEVSDVLADYENETEKLSIRKNQLEVLTQAANYSDELLQYGMVNYLEVLTAKDNALNTELAYITNKYNQLDAVIALYRALGGGY